MPEATRITVMVSTDSVRQTHVTSRGVSQLTERRPGYVQVASPQGVFVNMTMGSKGRDGVDAPQRVFVRDELPSINHEAIGFTPIAPGSDVHDLLVHRSAE